jgi:hypothetical protein
MSCIKDEKQTSEFHLPEWGKTTIIGFARLGRDTARPTRGADAPRSECQILMEIGAWRSPASALAWGARGRRFKSSRPDRKRDSFTESFLFPRLARGAERAKVAVFPIEGMIQILSPRQKRDSFTESFLFPRLARGAERAKVGGSNTPSGHTSSRPDSSSKKRPTGRAFFCFKAMHRYSSAV